MATAKVSRKGWVVIPKEIRERYGIRPGDRVAFVERGGSVSIRRLPDDPIKEGRGLLKDGPWLTEELLAERRKESQLEEERIRYWAGEKDTWPAGS